LYYDIQKLYTGLHFMNNRELPSRTNFYLAQEAAIASAKSHNDKPVSMDNPMVFDKNVLSTGNFILPNRNQNLNINEEQLEAIIANTNEYIKNGNSVEYIADHTSSTNKPFENFDNQKDKKSVINIGGYCKNFSKDGNWANCEIGMTSEGGVKLAQSSKDVSIELDYDFVDTQGNKYPAVIRKVAAVQKPIIPNQEGYSLKLSEHFADTETFVLTQTNEEDSMKDEIKKDDEQLGLLAKMFAPFLKKELNLSEEVEDEEGKSEEPSAEDKLKAEMESMKTQLEESDKALKASEKKNEKANKALEKSNLESLVSSAKKFVSRLDKLPIQADAKSKLAVALGLNEDEEKMNKVYLSENEDGYCHAEEIISIIENIEMISTEEKTVKLSEYHEKSDAAKEKEAEAEMDATANKTLANLGMSKKES